MLLAVRAVAVLEEVAVGHEAVHAVLDGRADHALLHLLPVGVVDAAAQGLSVDSATAQGSLVFFQMIRHFGMFEQFARVAGQPATCSGSTVGRWSAATKNVVSVRERHGWLKQNLDVKDWLEIEDVLDGEYGTPLLVEVLDADDEEILMREDVTLKTDISDW